MAGAVTGSYVLPDEQSIIPMPQSSVFFTLPRRVPVGYDRKRKTFVTVNEYRGAPVFAVAVFMPPGYVRTLHSAYREMSSPPRLPLYCYTAVGWKNNRFYAAGRRIDRSLRHEIADASLKTIELKACAMLKRHARNRLVSHLVNNCVFKYRCPNACNLVLGRWECPVPVSSACNAGCIGCISKQPMKSGFPASQHRLDFVPHPREIIDYVVPHLKKAANPVASFGQGCEGEPLLQADLIEESIREIRARTGRGIININTNASLPRAIERLCGAGLNSMRVSLNSAQAEYYTSYYRPKTYSFDDVLESMMIAKRHNVWVSINYLIFPGFTDHPSELNALKKLLHMTKLDMIQTRNLNIDPLWLIDELGLRKLTGNPIGIISWISEIRKCFPKTRMGYFNPTCRTMLKSR
jgi:pyruvate-formate lyase-activating enzyme